MCAFGFRALPWPKCIIIYIYIYKYECAAIRRLSRWSANHRRRNVFYLFKTAYDILLLLDIISYIIIIILTIYNCSAASVPLKIVGLVTTASADMRTCILYYIYHPKQLEIGALILLSAIKNYDHFRVISYVRSRQIVYVLPYFIAHTQ